MTRPNNEFEKIMELSNKILDEMEHRNEVDKEVDKLLANGQYEEVKHLLDSLDNNIIRQLREERDRLIHHIGTFKDDKLDVAEQEPAEAKKIISKLCHILHSFDSLIYIVGKLLYTELQDIIRHDNIRLGYYFFIITAMELCSYYLNLASDLLECPEKQVDIKLVSSYLAKIRNIFDVISDSSKIYIFPETINDTIYICYDYLEQIELELLSCGKGGGGGHQIIIDKEYISIPQIHKDSHLHEVYGLFYFREHKFCINTNATNNIILWIDSSSL